MGMPNSEPFLAEKDPKAIEFEFLSRPTLEFPNGCEVAASEDHKLHRLDEEQQEEEEKKEEKCQITVSSEELKMAMEGEFKVDDDDNGFRTPTSLDHKIQEEEKCQITVSSQDLKMATLGEFKVDDDDDGFRTPTSLVHKIQVKQCPPAPRKPKSLPSTKRKSSSNLPQQICFDLKDFESLFPPAPLAALGRKFKRLRGGGDTK